jgi:hypothetical protein
MRVTLKTTILRIYGTQRRFCRACQPPLRENRASSIIQGWVNPNKSERRTIAAALGRASLRGLFRNDVNGAARRGDAEPRDAVV